MVVVVAAAAVDVATVVVVVAMESLVVLVVTVGATVLETVAVVRSLMVTLTQLHIGSVVSQQTNPCTLKYCTTRSLCLTKNFYRYSMKDTHLSVIYDLYKTYILLPNEIYGYSKSIYTYPLSSVLSSL